MRIELNVIDEDGDECTEEHDLPGKFEVCPRCQGKGKHVNSNVDGYHGISQEEFDNDPQFYEDYRSGVYDVECERCHGMRVIEIVDDRWLNEDQKVVLKRWNEQQEDRESFNRECANEIRMQECMGGGF